MRSFVKSRYKDTAGESADSTSDIEDGLIRTENALRCELRLGGLGPPEEQEGQRLVLFNACRAGFAVDDEYCSRGLCKAACCLAHDVRRGRAAVRGGIENADNEIDVAQPIHLVGRR